MHFNPFTFPYPTDSLFDNQILLWNVSLSPYALSIAIVHGVCNFFMYLYY